MLRNSLQGSMFLGVEGLKHMNMWYRIKCQLKGSNKRQSNFISKKDGWVTSERIYRVGNGIFNTFLAKQIQINFWPNQLCQNYWHFKLSDVFSHPEREQNVRTIKRGNKQDLEGGRERERRESKYRTTQVFIEHATDKSRKQEREIKHTTKSNLPAFIRKNILIVPHPKLCRIIHSYRV